MQAKVGKKRRVQIMNIDYSQFYKGTTNIPSYGSGAYKKDTLVKYVFNTTDGHGNKVMDKMSREETLQAMKDIRSQYGDAVIVEFSGGGWNGGTCGRRERRSGCQHDVGAAGSGGGEECGVPKRDHAG